MHYIRQKDQVLGRYTVSVKRKVKKVTLGKKESFDVQMRTTFRE